MGGRRSRRQQFILGDDGELRRPDAKRLEYSTEKDKRSSRIIYRSNDSRLGFYIFLTCWSGAFAVECLKRITTEPDKAICGLMVVVPILGFVVSRSLNSFADGGDTRTSEPYNLAFPAIEKRKRTRWMDRSTTGGQTFLEDFIRFMGERGKRP
jgi:hypothetical protein